MSYINDITISSTGIGKLPLFEKADENGFSRVNRELLKCEFSAYKVIADDNNIYMSTVSSCGDKDAFLKELATLYPNKEFHYHSYYHGGSSYDFDFTFKDGEIVIWNENEASIYDDAEMFED